MRARTLHTRKRRFKFGRARLQGKWLPLKGPPWLPPYSPVFPAFKGLIAQSLKYVFRSDVWMMKLAQKKKVWPPPEHFLLGKKWLQNRAFDRWKHPGGYHHISPQMFWFPGKCHAINWNKKLMVITCNVFLSKYGWHVDVKHWKQIHESNTLFVRWRIRVISHAKLGDWCLRQRGFMTEYGKSKLRTGNQCVVTPDTLFPCPWVWIN